MGRLPVAWNRRWFTKHIVNSLSALTGIVHYYTPEANSGRQPRLFPSVYLEKVTNNTACSVCDSVFCFVCVFSGMEGWNVQKWKMLLKKSSRNCTAKSWWVSRTRRSRETTHTQRTKTNENEAEDHKDTMNVWHHLTVRDQNIYFYQPLNQRKNIL